MAVFRVNKTSGYTVISNYHLKEKRMSLKSKGLLTLMLSLPNDWDFSLKGLVALCCESERAIKTSMQELKEFGYLKIDKIPPKKGSNKFEYTYNIYERPLEKSKRQKINKNTDENVRSVKVQNEPVQNVLVQNSTDILNTKELNTKDDVINNNITTTQKENETTKEIEQQHQLIAINLAKTELSKLCDNKFAIDTALLTHRYKIQTLYKYLGRDKFLETFTKIQESSYLKEQAKNIGQFLNWLFSSKKENFLNVFNDVYADKDKNSVNNSAESVAYVEANEDNFDFSMWEGD
nr:hypothetical protein [uncultured Leptotrichia sp.]